MTTRRPDDDGPPSFEGSEAERREAEPGQTSWLTDLPLTSDPLPPSKAPSRRVPQPPSEPDPLSPRPPAPRAENLSLFGEPSPASESPEARDDPGAERYPRRSTAGDLPDVEGLLGEIRGPAASAASFEPDFVPGAVYDPPSDLAEEGDLVSTADPEHAFDPGEDAPPLEEGWQPPGANLSQRWLAGVVDLTVHVAVAVVLGVGSWLLGVRPEPSSWAPLGLFLLVFSFLYTVIPLAFWGRTPGMSRAGIFAAHGAEEPLTFGQTGMRWLASLLSLGLLGIPSLLALTPSGRSLVDRLSGSETHRSH